MDSSKGVQWRAFVRRSRLLDAPTEFPSVMEQVRVFLQPLVFTLAEGRDFDMQWQPPPDQKSRGQELLSAYGIDTRRMTDCSVCHR